MDTLPWNILVPNEPAEKETFPEGSGFTRAVFMFMDAPKSPAPLIVVPSPLCTCTPETSPVSDGMFTQKTSWDSASLSVMPLRVTLIWEPLLPRIVMAEFPSPVPPSL